MGNDDGGAQSGAGRACPAPTQSSETGRKTNEITINAAGDGSGCKNRVDLCEYRTADGCCRFRQQRCRWVATSLADGSMYGNIVQDINQMFLGLELTVKDGFQDLKREVRREKSKTPDTRPPDDNEAARVFALMKSLDAGDRTRKAPLHRVFRLLVLDGLSQNAAARQCRCSASLVSLRVKEIERRMDLSLTVLRTLATRVGEMEAVEDSRAGNIYRRGLTDDTGQDDS